MHLGRCRIVLLSHSDTQLSPSNDAHGPSCVLPSDHGAVLSEVPIRYMAVRVCRIDHVYEQHNECLACTSAQGW